MPRERRVQAEADWGRRSGARAGSGPVSPWLVVGVVFLAASLVAVGAVVVLSSLNGGRSSGSQGSEPPPTPVRPTPGVFSVGQQGSVQQGQTGSSPAAGPTP